MPLAPRMWLWERDEDARQACLVECLDVLDGRGPNPIRARHLACAVDWALRERARADKLEDTMRRHCQDAARSLEESLDLSSPVEFEACADRDSTH